MRKYFFILATLLSLLMIVLLFEINILGCFLGIFNFLIYLCLTVLDFKGKLPNGKCQVSENY